MPTTQLINGSTLTKWLGFDNRVHLLRSTEELAFVTIRRWRRRRVSIFIFIRYFSRAITWKWRMTNWLNSTLFHTWEMSRLHSIVLKRLAVVKGQTTHEWKQNYFEPDYISFHLFSEMRGWREVSLSKRPCMWTWFTLNDSSFQTIDFYSISACSCVRNCNRLTLNPFLCFCRTKRTLNRKCVDTFQIKIPSFCRLCYVNRVD